MNINISKSRKNSFLSNNLKNTSESSITDQTQQKNLGVSDNNKYPLSIIFSENCNRKSKGKMNKNETPSPNFSNDPKISNKDPLPYEKDNLKFSNIPGSRQNTIFNKLSFDNAISKKARGSLMPQVQDIQRNDNHFKSSFNEKNFNVINNISNLNNMNNKIVHYINEGNINPNTKNTQIERVSLASTNNEPVEISKNNIMNNKNIEGVNIKPIDLIQISSSNNTNNLNNLNANLNLGLSNRLPSNNMNNVDIISNNNFNSAETLGSPIIPMLPPQQINVNINNYNINNFNIQSAIPIKSTKKFFKFENINSSKHKNLLNLEKELSPKNFSNINSNILSINNLNPSIKNGSINNHIMNNDNIPALFNFENREYFSAGGKKKLNNEINARFNINKFFEDQKQKKIKDEFIGDNNIENHNLGPIIDKDKERSQPYNNPKNLYKEKEGNSNICSKKNSLNHQNSNCSKKGKQNENHKNKDDIIFKIDNKINFNSNDKKENCDFTNVNLIKNILSKEIIFDPGFTAKNIESVMT